MITRGHAGLCFDKLFDQFDRSAEWTKIELHKPPKDRESEDKGGKVNWLKYFNTEFGKPETLTAFAHRQRLLVEASGGSTACLTTTERFVTGLGRPHPVENGFLWHPTLAVPYLPGSSVKGLVRSWLEGAWGDATEGDRSVFRRVFGSDFRTHPEQFEKYGEHDNQAGSVIFLDAIPTAPVKLETDVMTPHYGPYYQGGAVPGDWHDPVPIPFLTVAVGQTFQFALLPRSSKPQGDADRAMGWLNSALTGLGAGAKTAVGYGRMKTPETRDGPPPATHQAGTASPKPSWHGNDSPLLAKIKKAEGGSLEQLAKQTLDLPPGPERLRCAQEIVSKTPKPIQKKAAANPGHWLRQIQNLLASSS